MRLDLQEERQIAGDEDDEPEEGVDGDDEEDGELEDEGGEGEGETGGGGGVRPFSLHSKVLVLIFSHQTLTHLLLGDVRILPRIVTVAISLTIPSYIAECGR